MHLRPLVALLPFALLAAACTEDKQLPPMAPPTAAAPLASSLPTADGGGITTEGGPGDGGLVVAADAGPLPSAAEAIRAAVSAPDRDVADRALDDGRHPAELLTFFGIAPGMQVGELISGGGYTAELLARVVGPTGTVFAENPPAVLDKFAAQPWNARLAKPIMNNVRNSDRNLDDPFPGDAKNLDAVLAILVYHDAVAMKVDRAKMNKAIYASLKPGGIYGIVDHAARAGAGTSVVGSLHRIEQRVVVDEVTKAGFKLAAEGDFLKNPSDNHDWSTSPGAAGKKRGTSDRFVLKFVKE
jgi:predicted methyltransferase